MDESAQDFLLELVGYGQPPYFVAFAGLLVAAACGLTFAQVIENRLEGWKQDRKPKKNDQHPRKPQKLRDPDTT